jgi:beta-phosphoglucomutase
MMQTELTEEIQSTIEQSNLIKAAIFDLDGVIVDTAHYHYLAWKQLASELGIDLTIEDNERLKGVSRIRSLEIILEIGNITMPERDKERLAEKKNSWFVDLIEKMKPEEIFPGVNGLIANFRSRGIKIGLASSSKNAQRVLDLLDIRDRFDVIVDGTMITHSKPDPEIFLLAAFKLGLDPKYCVVFEDAEAGVEAALRAGMKCVGVGDAELLSKANIVVRKTGDFNGADLETI